MMTVMYYMWWLLENYGTDPEATYLVNNRQMWFIPVVNPDGYVYNQQTNPNGGGFWRKNRRMNGGGSFGVDPNRNYGPFFMWDAPNGGSSTDPVSDTYRGPAPFSEPENSAIDQFMRGHNIRTCFNYHTSGNLMIYPWGYLSEENADSVIYRDWAYDLTAANHYNMGTDLQTVSYSTRGNSDDYMFGDLTKPVTYAMTPEVGTTGFWPSQPEIFPLAIENLPSNKLLSFFAGAYPEVRSYTIDDDGNNGYLDRGEGFELAVIVLNKGLGVSEDLTVSATSSSQFVTFTTPVLSPGDLASQTQTELRFAGDVHGSSTTGIPFQVYVNFSNPDGFSRNDTLNLYIGTPAVAFADSASGGIGNWTTGQGWGLTSNSHSAPNAFTDSPSGYYQANANNSLTLINQVSLAGYDYAELRFWTKWAIEPTWDFATVEVSTNNGSSWTTLRTTSATRGSGRSSEQPTTAWGYDSYVPGLTWKEESANLSPYAGLQIKLRFRLASDGGAERDGFHVDDIRIHGYEAVTDTGIIVTPLQFIKSGVTGKIFADSLTINNFTGNDLEFTVTESIPTGVSKASGRHQHPDGAVDIRTRLHAIRESFLKRRFVLPARQQVKPELSQESAYTTIITDERDELALGAADVYRVDHQTRSFLGITYEDFRIVLEDAPDSNLAVFLSIDTDQDFGTGDFPAPGGLGLSSRDIGSEREILLDGGGLLDTLGGLALGVVIDTETDSIVGFPFLLTVTRDSVFTIETNTFGFGIRQEWIGDTDNNMLVGAVGSRLSDGINPLPDFAPSISHGLVGQWTNTTWVSEDIISIVVPSGQSANIHVTMLAANLPGNYSSELTLTSASYPPLPIPINMTITEIGAPALQLSASGFSDTVAAGGSTTLDLVLSNQGSLDLYWGFIDTAGVSWVTVTPPFGSSPIGGSSSAAIVMNSTGFQPGVYSATLLLLSNDPSSSVLNFPLELYVENPTSVEDGDESIPVDFALDQNYPNPFNPSTRIQFDLPRESHVTIALYNILGQNVATLVDSRLPAGRHELDLNASALRLPSGVYLYRMDAGGYTRTRKMVLMK